MWWKYVLRNALPDGLCIVPESVSLSDCVRWSCIECQRLSSGVTDRNCKSLVALVTKRWYRTSLVSKGTVLLRLQWGHQRHLENPHCWAPRSVCHSGGKSFLQCWKHSGFCESGFSTLLINRRNCNMVGRYSLTNCLRSVSHLVRSFLGLQTWIIASLPSHWKCGRLCFDSRVFICMRVPRITQKLLNRIAWNFVGCLVIIRRPFD